MGLKEIKDNLLGKLVGFLVGQVLKKLNSEDIKDFIDAGLDKIGG